MNHHTFEGFAPPVAPSAIYPPTEGLPFGGQAAGVGHRPVDAHRQPDGLAVFQPLVSGAPPLVSGGGSIFAAAGPLQELAYPPKARLDQVRQHLQLLRNQAGVPEQAVLLRQCLDRLEAGLGTLDCQGLPMSTHLPAICFLREHGADPQQRETALRWLAVLDTNMRQLAQLHPSLAAPDVHTPAELRVYLDACLGRCRRDLQAGLPLQALEWVSAMEEQAWLVDADGSVYPALFQALRQLYRGICAHAWQAPLEAVARALPVLADSAAAPAGGEPAAAPVAWPAGSLIPQVRTFIASMQASGSSCRPSDCVDRVRQQFGVSQHVAIYLIMAARDVAGLYDGLAQLCSNVVKKGPLPRFTANHISTAPLNVIVQYQHDFDAQQKTAVKKRPIPMPASRRFQTPPQVDRLQFQTWARIIWNEVAMQRTRFGEYVRFIDATLEAAGAFEDDGVYISVEKLLKQDYRHNVQVFNALNNNANFYRARDNRNFTSSSEVTGRTDPLSHGEIEDDIMDVIRAHPLQTPFTQHSFGFMDYPPTYIHRRLLALVRSKRLLREDSWFRLNPQAPDRQKASPASTGKRRAATAVSSAAAGSISAPKKSRSAATGPGATAAGPHGKASTVVVPRAVATLPAGVPLVSDARLASLLRGANGLPTNLAVRCAANTARIMGRFNADDADLHPHALANAIRDWHNVNIWVEHDPTHLGTQPPQMYHARGGHARPLIRLRHLLEVGADGQVVMAHYEYMVPGRHTTWQKTPPNGDCLYEAIALALYEAGLTAAPYAVAVLRELTAREIERRLDDYRAWIPVATAQDLRALSAGLPRAAALLPGGV